MIHAHHHRLALSLLAIVLASALPLLATARATYNADGLPTNPEACYECLSATINPEQCHVPGQLYCDGLRLSDNTLYLTYTVTNPDLYSYFSPENWSELRRSAISILGPNRQQTAQVFMNADTNLGYRYLDPDGRLLVEFVFTPEEMAQMSGQTLGEFLEQQAASVRSTLPQTDGGVRLYDCRAEGNALVYDVEVPDYIDSALINLPEVKAGIISNLGPLGDTMKKQHFHVIYNYYCQGSPLTTIRISYWDIP